MELQFLYLRLHIYIHHSKAIIPITVLRITRYSEKICMVLYHLEFTTVLSLFFINPQRSTQVISACEKGRMADKAWEIFQRMPAARRADLWRR
jgi:pentatricopeptide repeat protein